jgi:hypothetical protein
MDVIFIGLVALLYGATVALVRTFERLRRGAERR